MAAKKVIKKKVKKVAKKAPKKHVAKKKAMKKVVKKAVKHVKKVAKKVHKVAAKKPMHKPEHHEEKKEKMKEVGKIAHFFDGIGVAVVEVTGRLKTGDKIRIKGASTDFEQSADSMQIDRRPINETKPGDRIGLKVREKVHDNDKVYVID